MALDRISTPVLISVVWLGLAAGSPAQTPPSHHHCYEDDTGIGIRQGQTSSEEIDTPHCMEFYGQDPKSLQDFRRKCQRKEDARWGTGPCPSSKRVGACCLLGSGVYWHLYQDWAPREASSACGRTFGTWIPAASIRPRKPGNPLFCRPCESGLMEIAAQSPYEDGCILDTWGNAEIKLSAVLSDVLLRSGLDEDDVEWTLIAGDGLLTQIEGPSTTFTQIATDHGETITVMATAGGDSTMSACGWATVTFAPRQIFVHVLSADGEGETAMGISTPGPGFEEREVLLEAKILNEKPADYKPDLIQWGVERGDAGKLTEKRGDTNTLQQQNVLSGSAYETWIVARYTDNIAGGGPFLASNHRLRPTSVLLPNSHPPKTGAGVPGWAEGREPGEVPATFATGDKAKLELVFEIQPELTGIDVEIRSTGMDGALAIPPVKVSPDIGKLRVPATEVGTAFSTALGPMKVRVDFEARFAGGKWVEAGFAELLIEVQ